MRENKIRSQKGKKNEWKKGGRNKLIKETYLSRTVKKVFRFKTIGICVIEIGICVFINFSSSENYVKFRFLVTWATSVTWGDGPYWVPTPKLSLNTISHQRIKLSSEFPVLETIKVTLELEFKLMWPVNRNINLRGLGLRIEISELLDVQFTVPVLVKLLQQQNHLHVQYNPSCLSYNYRF